MGLRDTPIMAGVVRNFAYHGVPQRYLKLGAANEQKSGILSGRWGRWPQRGQCVGTAQGDTAMDNTGWVSACQHEHWVQQIIGRGQPPRRWWSLLLALVVGTLLFSLAQPFASTAHAATLAHNPVHKSGPPHKVDPKSGTTSVIHLPPAVKTVTTSTTPQTIGRLGTPSMTPGSLPLSPTATTFKGSDGIFEIDIPAGAVNATDVQSAGGGITLKVTQIAPASGASGGGSGIVSFGTYLIQLVDGHGTALKHGLRQAATLKLHYLTKTSTLDMDHASLIFNGAIPKNAPVAHNALGAYYSEPATNDYSSLTLSGTLPIDTSLTTGAAGAKTFAALIPSTQTKPPVAPWSVSWVTNNYAPAFGKPGPFSKDLSYGSLTEGTQIDVPAGPGGTLPNITLAYNSNSVSQQHSPQAAGNWVGEGWNLGLGQITWTQHNVLSSSTSTTKWQDSWQLVDPFGTSEEIIPPNLGISTYYDLSPNNPMNGLVAWHTADESHDRIYSYTGALNIGMPEHPPCFRVFLTNGVMEEFGCTADSLQYYYVPTVGDQIAAWNLDLITDPHGDQVHLTYQSDAESITYNSVHYTYQRDTVLSTVQWDSPACLSATTMCTGSSWQPLDQVVFNASHTPARLTNIPSGCNTGTNYRCDDPGASVLPTPEVQSTFALNDIAVQTRTCAPSCGSWNSLRDYKMSYEQSGPTAIIDPVTGHWVSTAGMFDLTALQEVGDDGTTAYPTTTYGYATETESYVDGVYTPYSTTACGPTWNTGGNGGTCDLWSLTEGGNSRYLTSASNGQGLAQTFSWANAHNNTHGAAQPTNPLYCDASQSGYPCDEADDQAWSQIVLTQESDTVQQVTQAGQGGYPDNAPCHQHPCLYLSAQYPRGAGMH